MRVTRLVCAVTLLVGGVVFGSAACAEDDRCCPTGGDCNGFFMGGLRENGGCAEMRDVDGRGSHLGTDENGCPVVVGTGSCLHRRFDSGRPVTLDDADGGEAAAADSAALDAGDSWADAADAGG